MLDLAVESAEASSLLRMVRARRVACWQLGKILALQLGQHVVELQRKDVLIIALHYQIDVRADPGFKKLLQLVEVLHVLLSRNAEVKIYELQELHLHQIQLLQRYPAISTDITVQKGVVGVALLYHQAAGHQQSARTRLATVKITYFEMDCIFTANPRDLPSTAGETELYRRRPS